MVTAVLLFRDWSRLGLSHQRHSELLAGKIQPRSGAGALSRALLLRRNGPSREKQGFISRFFH